VPTTNSVTRFRRRTGVAAVIAFPVVLALSDLVAPSFQHGEALATAVAAHPGRTWALASLRLAAAALFVLVLFTMLLHVRERGGRLAHVAAALGLLGALGQAQDSAYQLFVLSLRHEAPAVAGAQLDRLDRLAAPLELPLLLAFALALVLVVGAARRAGLVPLWALLAAAAAFVVHVALGASGAAVADLLLIAAYAELGRRLSGRPAAMVTDLVTAEAV
jgi:hypothetical protein